MMNNGIFPIVLFALSFFGALGANADVALGTAVRGRGGVVFTVPPQSRTVWADVEWVVGGETNTAWRHLHLFGDGEERRYFFDGATAVRWGANYPDRSIADKWNGAITSFRVLNNKTKEEVPIRDMRIVTDNPGLPPELILSHAPMPMQLDRAGRPVDIEVGVFNIGTVAATGVTVRVEGLPEGVRVVIGARNTPPCPSGASPLSEGGEPSGFHRKARIQHSPPPQNENCCRALRRHGSSAILGRTPVSAGRSVFPMERRVGFVGIILENPARDADEVNRVISRHSHMVLARLGLPPREGRSVAVITLVVEATTDELGAFTGALGRIPGLSVKSALRKGGGERCP